MSTTVRLLLASAFCAAGLAALTPSAGAAGKNDTPPPATAPQIPPPAYEAQLLHLARILGSVDYLRQLCGDDDGDRWRTTMQKLIDTEARGEAERIKRLTAAFNRGYRSFASVYTACTESAVTAEQEYRREGATVAGQITAKYGN